MKKKTILFLVLVLLFLILLTNGLQGQEKGNGILTWLTGNKYLNMPEEVKSFYVGGLLDMFFFQTNRYDPELYFDIEIAVKNMEVKQTKAVFDKYLEEHPEEWHHSAASSFWVAIMEIVAETIVK